MRDGRATGIVGDLSARRVLRVAFRRWYEIAAFLAAGAGAAWLFVRFVPKTYEATATFTMNLYRPPSEAGELAASWGLPDSSIGYGELFVTRYSEWRSEEVVTGILQKYRAINPNSKYGDDEILEALRDSRIELRQSARTVEVTVPSPSPRLCADLANAYVAAIAANAEKRRDKRRDRALKRAGESVARQRERVAALARAAAAARVTNGVDSMRIDLEIASRSLSYVVAELLRLETEAVRLRETSRLLDEIVDDPSRFGALQASDHRSAEIARAAEECDSCEKKCRSMLTMATKRHPEVRQAGRELLAARARLRAAVRRAAESGRASLAELGPRISALQARRTLLEREKQHWERMIALSEGSVSRNERAVDSARAALESLTLELDRVSAAALEGRETVVPGCPPSVPEDPVFPPPIPVYIVALSAAALLGVFAVLVLDRFEDLVIDVWDVMDRTGRPVLATLPHLRVKGRGDVVRSAVEDPHSDFAEAVRSLRMTLETTSGGGAGRHVLVVSTCPGEGKTVTAATLAADFARSGLRTLLADFDMRRPRQAEAFGLRLSKETSLSHFLSSSTPPGSFAPPVLPTFVPGLDVAASLPPDGMIDPATIVGSMSTRMFFDWARRTYDAFVIDAPPFGTVADTVPLSTYADRVVVMCRPDRTNGGNLASCIAYLEDAGADVAGVVVNDVTPEGGRFTAAARRPRAEPCPRGADQSDFDDTRQFAEED